MVGWKTIWFEPSCPFNKVLTIFFTRTNLIGSGSVLFFSFRRILVKGIVKWAEPCNCYSSHFKDTLTLENQPFVKRMEILIFHTHRPLSAIISPFQFTKCHPSEGCLFTSEKLVTQSVRSQ